MTTTNTKKKGINDLQYESLMAHDIRFDPNDSAPNYVGLNPQYNADGSEVNWVVYKFTYDGTDVTRIQKIRGSWDDRVSLFS